MSVDKRALFVGLLFVLVWVFVFWSDPGVEAAPAITNPAPSALLSKLAESPEIEWDKMRPVAEVVAEWERAKQPKPKPVARKSPPRKVQTTKGVEQWRSLVKKYFGENTDAALSVMGQESGGNPNSYNKSSGASGLFQQMPQYWAKRSAAAGFPGASIFDPEANIATSAYLSRGGRSWSHWSCKPR